MKQQRNPSAKKQALRYKVLSHSQTRAYGH
jgi:hypothetical protein